MPILVMLAAFCAAFFGVVIMKKAFSHLHGDDDGGGPADDGGGLAERGSADADDADDDGDDDGGDVPALVETYAPTLVSAVSIQARRFFSCVGGSLFVE